MFKGVNKGCEFWGLIMKCLWMSMKESFYLGLLVQYYGIFMTQVNREKETEQNNFFLMQITKRLVRVVVVAWAISIAWVWLGVPYCWSFGDQCVVLQCGETRQETPWYAKSAMPEKISLWDSKSTRKDCLICGSTLSKIVDRNALVNVPKRSTGHWIWIW